MFDDTGGEKTTLLHSETLRLRWKSSQIMCSLDKFNHGQVYCNHMAVCQNLVPLVNIKIAGKWMFIPLKMVLIGIDPYPCAAKDVFG